MASATRGRSRKSTRLESCGSSSRAIVCVDERRADRRVAPTWADAYPAGGLGDLGSFIQEVTAMTTPLIIPAALLAVLAAGAPLAAHHSFAAEFDGSKPVTL